MTKERFSSETERLEQMEPQEVADEVACYRDKLANLLPMLSDGRRRTQERSEAAECFCRSLNKYFDLLREVDPENPLLVEATKTREEYRSILAELRDKKGKKAPEKKMRPKKKKKVRRKKVVQPKQPETAPVEQKKRGRKPRSQFAKDLEAKGFPKELITALQSVGYTSTKELTHGKPIDRLAELTEKLTGYKHITEPTIVAAGVLETLLGRRM